MIRGEDFYAQLATRRGVYATIDGQPEAAWPALILTDMDAATVATLTDASDPVIEVRVEGDRMIADCPFCSSAQIAFETDLRYLCTECGNAEAGGAFVPTVWP